MGWALQQRNGGKTMKGSKEKQPAAMFTRELEVQLCSQIQVSPLFALTIPRPMLLRAHSVSTLPHPYWLQGLPELIMPSTCDAARGNRDGD